ALSEAVGPESADEGVLDALLGTYDPLAEERLARGCGILSGGRVVVTDRLHGHVLCLVLGVPHVLLDNSYGKVRGFYETWTAGCPLPRWAAPPAGALDQARALAATAGPPTSCPQSAAGRGGRPS